MGGGGPGYSKRWGCGDLGIVRGGGPEYNKRRGCGGTWV